MSFSKISSSALRLLSLFTPSRYGHFKVTKLNIRDLSNKSNIFIIFIKSQLNDYSKPKHVCF